MPRIEDLERHYHEDDERSELDELFTKLREELGWTQAKDPHQLTTPHVQVYPGEAPTYEGRTSAFLLASDLYFETEAKILNQEPLPSLDDVRTMHQTYHTDPDKARAIQEGHAAAVTLPQLYWMLRRNVDWAEYVLQIDELTPKSNFATITLPAYRHLEQTLRPLVTPNPEAGPPPPSPPTL